MAVRRNQVVTVFVEMSSWTALTRNVSINILFYTKCIKANVRIFTIKNLII